MSTIKLAPPPLVARLRVAPRTHYSASNREHLEELADRMNRLTDARKMAGVTLTHLHGLMLPRGISFVLALKIIRLLGTQAVIGFFHKIYQNNPTEATNLWNQTIQHMLHGQDREDATSVGGWSQRELNIFVQEILPRIMH